MRVERFQNFAVIMHRQRDEEALYKPFAKHHSRETLDVIQKAGRHSASEPYAVEGLVPHRNRRSRRNSVGARS